MLLIDGIVKVDGGPDMLRRTRLIAAALITVPLVAACASGGSSTDSAAPLSAAPPPSASPAPAAGEELTARGNKTATIGQRIGSYGPPMAPEIGQYFTITSINPAPKCQQAAGTATPVPENGRFLAVNLKVEDTAVYDKSQGGYYTATAQKWDFVADDGTAYDEVDTLPAFYCTGKASPFQSGFAPGRTYSGTVYIDVPKGPGFMIYGQGSNTGPGYEYKID